MSLLTKSLYAIHGQSLQIERNNNILYTLEGRPQTEHTTHRPFFCFNPTDDIQIGDWIINSCGERFYVYDINTAYLSHNPDTKRVFYQTEAEYMQSYRAKSTNPITIAHVNQTVIGDNNIATISYNDALNSLKNQAQSGAYDDSDKLQEIITLLEKIVNNQTPVSKGLFCKFSETMERHSWLSGSIASVIMSWLTGNM